MFILLCLYTFFVFIRPQEFIGIFKIFPFMPVLFVFLLIGMIFVKDKAFHFPQDKFLVMFFIFAVLSHLFHLYFSGALGVFTGLLPVISLYYIITNSLNTLERIEKYFSLIIVLSLVMAIHGIHQYYNDGIGWTGQTFAPKTTRIRYIGIFSDPNDLSLVFLFSIPLIIYFFAEKKKFLLRIVNIFTLAVILFAMILTQSRGAMVSLGAMMAYYGVRKYGMKKGLIIGAILLLPLIIVFSTGKFLAISTEEESAYGRIDAWYEGFQMLIHSPIWGVGPGMFTEYNYLTAHNSYVLCFAENGLVGYFFWLGSIYFTFIGLSKSIKIELTDAVEGKIISPSFFLTISLIGFLAASFFLSRTYTIILYMNLGVISAYLYMMEKENNIDFYKYSLQKDIFAVIGIVFASILIIFLFVKMSV